MKPNELRIGNLVYDSTMNTTVVESIIPEHGRVRHPIPLTEKWLVRFGFDSLGKFGYGIGQFRLEFSKNLAKDHGVEFVFWIDRSIIPIKSVHQLQNLYFALTGEELTITT